MPIPDIIAQYLTNVSDRIKDDQRQKGIYASGESADSLTVKVKENEGTLTGSSYFEQQQFGQSASEIRQIPFKEQVANLFGWAKTKSFLQGTSAQEKLGIAIATTKKQRKEGTQRGNNPKYPGLSITEIINEETPDFIEKIGPEVASDLASDIQRIWDKLNG